MGEECDGPVNTRQVESMILINKFSSLALEFKTDRQTLQERLDVQRRLRDQAEHNLELEMQRLRDLLTVSGHSPEERQSHSRALQSQVDIIKQISLRLASIAEVLGAVQQELRVSQAVEVMTQHVEALRHLYEREHTELALARRLLVTHRLSVEDAVVATGRIGPGGRRRASIAVVAAQTGPADVVRAAGGGRAATAAPLSGGGVSPVALKRRRKSLDANDGLLASGFTCIAEECEEETQEEMVTQLPTPEIIEHLQRFATTGQEETLRSAVEATVSDELATLRCEQELLAQDLRHLLHSQTAAALQHSADAGPAICSSSVGRALADLLDAWPYSWEETTAHARHVCGGVFLVLALVVLLMPAIFSSAAPG